MRNFEANAFELPLILTLLYVVDDTQHLGPIVLVDLVRQSWNVKCAHESFQDVWIRLEADSSMAWRVDTGFGWRRLLEHERRSEQSDTCHNGQTHQD